MLGTEGHRCRPELCVVFSCTLTLELADGWQVTTRTDWRQHPAARSDVCRAPHCGHVTAAVVSMLPKVYLCRHLLSGRRGWSNAHTHPAFALTCAEHPTAAMSQLLLFPRSPRRTHETSFWTITVRERAAIESWECQGVLKFGGRRGQQELSVR